MEAKRVLVTENISPIGLEIMREAGLQVDVRLYPEHDELVRIIPEYQALVVRALTTVDREIIQAATSLKVIGRSGVTVENIDIAAATERGVIVCNAQASTIMSVAEMAMAQMLACARQLPQANASMHAHRWKRAPFTGVELFEKTLAIFGLGRVGSLVAERARAFGMNLIAYDPYCSPERAEQLGVTLYESIEDVLPKADFITIHLPLTSETTGMFGPDQFAMMKDGVILVNVSQAAIVNAKALADFIAAGRVAACGIDMFEEMPCKDSPLHEFDQALLTSRLGGSTVEARERASKSIAQSVIAALNGQVVPGALNLTPVKPESVDAVAPYVPACQSMGRILAQIAGGIPGKMKLVTAGSLAHADTSALSAAALTGMFSMMRTYSSVDAYNVDAVARRHGVHIETDAQHDAHGFESFVSIVADDCEIGATLIGRNSSMRIISLMGYQLEISPAGRALIFEYVDAPGRMGTIGTILGKAGVNITTMQIATKPEEQCALVYMNVEGEVGPAVLDELRAALPLKNLWSISL